MRELILEDAPRTPDDFIARAAAVGDLARDLAGSAVTPDQKTQATGMAALGEALAAEATTYRLVLPNVLIGDRLDIAGERRLSILGYGRGHTASDLVVHLPDDGVTIAGDLVWTGIHPKTTDGFPDDWAHALDRLVALEATHVIPGHGQPGTDADVAAMSGYIRQLAAMVGEVRNGGLDPEAADPPSGSGEWHDVPRFRHGLRALARRVDEGS
jgi:glyoxylase-like metal-dependent hydrolase (beta-lactamase superfamily II)